jgi:glycosyltransferase involved in cell wall biosynthesis
MKIGLTIRTFYPKSGGLQAHAERLANELQQMGHQVTILTRAVSRVPSFRDYFFFSETVTQTTINGVAVRVLCHPWWWNGVMWLVSLFIDRKSFQRLGIWLFNLYFVPQIVKTCRGVDVIHHVGQAHELIGFAAAAAAQKLKVPFVVQPTVHPGQWGDSPLDLSFYQQAGRLLVHTEYERSVLQQYGIKQTVDVVGNGIEDRQDGNAERFRKTYGIHGPIILFLGRKDEDKGYFLLKQSFPLVRAHNPDVTLVCMGPSGSSESSSMDGCRDILEIEFASEQTKHDALAACTFLCVPSVGESFGLVYMEAGRYRKPSIGRRLPVLEELLNHHDAALLVGSRCEQNNQILLDPHELSGALLKLLNDSVLLESLGDNAYSISGKFVWERVAPRFEESYRCAIESRN